MSEVECCPECGADFKGDPIPEEYQDKYYGGETHYSRLIGIEDPMVYDGISWWKCPDCEHIWKRFPWSPDFNEGVTE